ncbi:MAG: hypothetical protein QM483_12700 [Desulfuromusa sp.]
MRNSLLISGLIIGSILFSSQLALSQEPITDQKILSSFAKIIRANQYICRSCFQVQLLENNHDELSYKVVCNHDLTYKVVLTPRSNMIVRPINGLHSKQVSLGLIAKQFE